VADSLFDLAADSLVKHSPFDRLAARCASRSKSLGSNPRI
jgi:hypothetical protein